MEVVLTLLGQCFLSLHHLQGSRKPRSNRSNTSPLDLKDRELKPFLTDQSEPRKSAFCTIALRANWPGLEMIMSHDSPVQPLAREKLTFARQSFQAVRIK